MIIPALALAGLLADPSAPLTDRDSAVLSAAILEWVCGSRVPGIKLVEDETSPFYFDTMLEGFDKDIVHNLQERGAVPGHIPDVRCPGVQVQPAERIEAASQQKPPKRGETSDPDFASLRRSFPGASSVTTLTLPGYSTSGDLAFVIVDTVCPGLCGSDVLLMLKLVRGKWSLLRYVPLAVS